MLRDPGIPRKRFLSVLNDERIEEARKSLSDMLGLDTLEGLFFLDVGCGSGLFSLAARSMGATVTSFDFDPDSVGCAEELRRRYFPDDGQWQISEGSALDAGFLESLGQFDIVYSWGVLHHTGHMWDALELISGNVRENGKLFISIYNDQGFKSRVWRRIKQYYCSGLAGKVAVSCVFIPIFIVLGLLQDLVAGRNPVRRYHEYSRKRGMSIYYDWLDWLGGYPFEVATTQVITEFYTARGFRLFKLVKAPSLGTNQFVFQRLP